MVKTVLKKILPPLLIKIINKIKNRKIKNLYKRYNGEKKVLISYITSPFRIQSNAHTNNYEVVCAAKIFDELGYIVDVINYDNPISELDNYNVIYGFGDVFQKYFEGGFHAIKTIYYGAGMHVCHQNTATLKRVKDVYLKKGFWLSKSARFVEKTWSHQTTLVDGIIALGNHCCEETYRLHYDGKIVGINAPYFNSINPRSVLLNRKAGANKSYLWFGSSGLIHKGLDLCLDFFKSRPDLTLHICGHVAAEQDFNIAYRNELYQLSNIHMHGFVNINSEKFNEILENCSFVIFPSCSEGGSPSLITAVGNGALIPIITKETSVSTGYEIPIKGFSVMDLKEAIDASEKLSSEEIIRFQTLNLEYVMENNNKDTYYYNLKSAIKEILAE
ncbi:glycosyltransferase [Limnohabitans sp. 2KL-27]|jgi:hypothetical protein|uniref:glycosyltransferase n=1 Tax=Limnohabitans sp. 2KL-27 TaxID=1100705 RepID=UPI000A5ADBDA|nr:glycosyltransferase [Limnohabitans sp. 2KL-27]